MERLFLSHMKEFSSDMQLIIEEACTIYASLKDMEILNYNKIDKKCLSLLLGILSTNNCASKIFEDFNIDYQVIAETIGFYNETKCSNVPKIYIEEFRNLIASIQDKSEEFYTRTFTPTLLAKKLFLPNECGSDFLSDIYQRIGYIRENESSRKHYSYDMFEKQLEYEDEKRFASLEKDSIKNNRFDSDVVYQLGLNPYDIDLSLGRENELKKLMLTLLMPSKSALLVGPSGVGKTALVKGFAHRIATGRVPKVFRNKKVLSLNVAAIVSGCKFVGMFEEKLIKIIKQLEKDENAIVFIDEIHSTIGAGKGINSSNDMANILKPYLENGNIKVIGTTTSEEYEKYIKQDPGFKRRFELLNIKEPDAESLRIICENMIKQLEIEMDLFFLADDNQKDYILNELIKFTDKKRNAFFDSANNPDLIISILTRSFATAKYYERQVVEISDIIEAINDTDRFYEENKQRLIRRISLLRPKNNSQKCKIIAFNSLG